MSSPDNLGQWAGWTVLAHQDTLSAFDLYILWLSLGRQQVEVLEGAES